MKKGIHPKYQEITASCVCGNSVELGSTKGEIRVEICSACHPFYTGQQKIVDTEGRVDRFVKRYKLDKKKDADQKAEAPAETKADSTEQNSAEAAVESK